MELVQPYRNAAESGEKEAEVEEKEVLIEPTFPVFWVVLSLVTVESTVYFFWPYTAMIVVCAALNVLLYAFVRISRALALKGAYAQQIARRKEEQNSMRDVWRSQIYMGLYTYCKNNKVDLVDLIHAGRVDVSIKDAHSAKDHLLNMLGRL